MLKLATNETVDSVSTAHRVGRGISILELVIVLVIIGAVSTIAIRRFGTAAPRAVEAAVEADLSRIRNAIEQYRIDHDGRSPDIDSSGQVDPSGANFVQRIMKQTTTVGNLKDGGPHGPYLVTFPKNPLNGLATVRIGGGNAGAKSHGWYYDPVNMVVSSDVPTNDDETTVGTDPDGSDEIETPSGATEDPDPGEGDEGGGALGDAGAKGGDLLVNPGDLIGP